MPSTLIDRVANSTPMVDFVSRLNSLRVNRESTAEQPESLRQTFDTLYYPSCSGYARLLDNDGRIVCWFLPDLIDPSRVVSLDLICQWTILLTSDCSLNPKQWVNEAIVGLNSILLKGQVKDDKSNKSNWRTNDVFKKPSQANLFAPGCVDFSPAWFAQGHDAVSVI